ncbi:MAG TPA: carboxypeptidase regulatory-like domain-containing protein [Jatrophihabitans sp.]|nr:carboxypeptidase regulatory-like domain-containing protein [Jatrophihabitans sp.]
MKRFVLPALALLLAAGVVSTTSATAVAATVPAAPHRSSTTDTTPPGPVTALTMSGNALRTISLRWTNPADADLAHVMIRRAVGSQPPLSASDGTVVALLGKRTTTFTDRHLSPGTTYSYAVYAFDRSRNQSTPATITARTLTTDDRTGIKGALTDQAGHPISGAWAEVRVAGSGDWAGQATTAADGSYRVTNLQPGSYTVCFEATSQTTGPSPTGYLNDCYRQQPYGYGDTGTPVTVVAGKMTAGITDYLPVAGAIAGRITDPSGGGIGNVEVYVANPQPPYYNTYSVNSAADGSYTLAGLPAGSYQICFDAYSATGPNSAGYLSECYDNQPQYGGGGTPIPVSLGQTTAGIDAVLDLGGAVTGTVTDPAGNPVQGVFTTLIPDTGNSGSTDEQGHYTITGAAPGVYTVCFDGTYAGWGIAPYGYTSDCFDGRASFELSAGQTVTGQDTTLQLAGAIGGSVSGTDGPLAGVWVNVFDSTGAQVNGTSTDENGNWQLPGFRPGQYTVCYDPTYTSGGYRRGCYDGQPDGYTTGTPVTVTGGQLTTVDDTLQLGAGIAGTVTDSAGTPLSGVQVSARSVSGGTGWYYATTGSDGSYRIGGVDPDSYAVCFDASYAQGPAAGGYTSECYDNQPTQETADPVVVGDSGTVTVDAQLAAGSAVTGTVTDQNGAAVLGEAVTATSLSTGQSSYASTGIDGSYLIPGLAAGDYTVCFQSYASSITPPTGYVDQCWQDQQVPYGGTPVQVGTASVTSGIDATLRVGGEVIGTVTDGGGAAVPDVSVTAQGSDGTWYDAYGYTDSAGHYTLLGLPAVPLAVCFQPPYGYASQCYRNAPDAGSATPVTPTSGAITTGIDAVLQPAN